METCYKVMVADVARDFGWNRIASTSSRRLRQAPPQGNTILEQPVRFEPRARAQGKKIGWRDGVRALVVLLKYRFWG